MEYNHLDHASWVNVSSKWSVVAVILLMALTARANDATSLRTTFLESNAGFEMALKSADAYINEVAAGVTAGKVTTINAPASYEKLSYNDKTVSYQNGVIKAHDTGAVVLTPDPVRGYLWTTKNSNSDPTFLSAAPAPLKLLVGRQILESAMVIKNVGPVWTNFTLVRSEGNPDEYPLTIGLGQSYYEETTSTTPDSGVTRTYTNCVPVGIEVVSVGEIEQDAVKQFCARIFEMSGMSWSKVPLMSKFVSTRWRSIESGIILRIEVDSRTTQRPGVLSRTERQVTAVNL